MRGEAVLGSVAGGARVGRMDGNCAGQMICCGNNKNKNKTSVVSFSVKDLHPFDIGTLLDKQGIAVRTGHHCTQPLMDFYKIPGTVRASFAFYNTMQEIDQFVIALERSLNMLK